MFNEFRSRHLGYLERNDRCFSVIVALLFSKLSHFDTKEIFNKRTTFAPWNLFKYFPGSINCYCWTRETCMNFYFYSSSRWVLVMFLQQKKLYLTETVHWLVKWACKHNITLYKQYNNSYVASKAIFDILWTHTTVSFYSRKQ